MRNLTALFALLMLAAAPVTAQQVTIPRVLNAGGKQIEVTPVITVDQTGAYVAGGGGSSGGDASAANQTAVQATPGADASKVVAVQGVTGARAVAVSASALPLPTGAATAAKQPALGTAGTASTDVITVQGITSGTPLIVGGAVASGATDSGNPTKVGGKYNSTLPTFTDGQRGDIQIGTRGALHVELWQSDGAAPISNANGTGDGQAATTTGIRANAWGYVFNGATWDRTRSALNAANTTGTGVTAVGGMGQCDDTSQTAITENSFGNLRINCTTHALITQPYETNANAWNYAAASGGISNTTTAVTIQAADATRKICVVGLQMSAPTLGAGTEVALRDGAGGTVLWRGYMSTAGGNQSLTSGMPICGTANTLMEVVTLTATVTGAIYFNAQGFLRQ